MEVPLPAVTIYTDGSYNPGKYPCSPGGWAAIMIDPASPAEPKAILKGSIRNVPDSGTMEVIAVIKALESLETSHVVHLFSDLQPLTDLMKAYTEHPNQRAGLRASYLDNPDDRRITSSRELFPVLFDLLDKHHVSISEVRGHTGHIWNDLADQRAKSACRDEGLASRKEIKIRARLLLDRLRDEGHDDPGAITER